MLQTTAGIVLRTLKYKDSALLADIYTEALGRASFIIKIPRNRKFGIRASLFQPLSLVELVFEVRSHQPLHTVSEAKLLQPFVSIPFDPCKSAIALFLSEFLYRAIHEELENPALFSYLRHSICWLDACQQGYANFHLVFLMRLSRFLGLYPNLEEYTAGACFDLLNACFTPLPPQQHRFYIDADESSRRLSRFLGLYPNLEEYTAGACFDLLNACFTPLPPQQHRFYIDADESSRLVTLMRMNYDTMHLFAMNRQERARCLTVLNDYYRLHLPNFPVLKSLEVLRELFD